MELKVIKGGGQPKAKTECKFIFAKATNTRLMGVVGLYIFAESKEDGPVHFYVYYDAEELGIDHVDVYKGTDEFESTYTLLNNFGGLGGDFAELSEKECCHLLRFFRADTLAKGEKLCSEFSLLEWLFAKDPELTSSEQSELWAKLCVPIETDYGAINYYIMRCVAFDKAGADMVKAEGAKTDSIQAPAYGAFLRNKITKLPDGSYKAETLAEAGGVHYVLVSILSCFRKKVISAKLCSCRQVSLYEASILLRRDEFVSVFSLKNGLSEAQEKALDLLTLGATDTEHESGVMHMCFKTNNRHVEKELFMLSDDIRAMFFEGCGGEIIAAAYDLECITAAEEALVAMKVAKGSELTDRYRFANPLLLDYADSGFDKFCEFVEYLE